MILGSPTETTMGSDEKRSGEIDSARRSDDPDRTRNHKMRSTNGRTPIWSGDHARIEELNRATFH
jgi:hypothetical protein